MKRPSIQPINPEAYDIFTTYIDDLHQCYKDIEEATERLRRLKEPQEAIITAALCYAHANDFLQPLAQYLYFDTPVTVSRDIVKNAIRNIIGTDIQKWLCEGYFFEKTCGHCRKLFPCQVTSFSHLRDLKKEERDRRWPPMCPSCKESSDHKNAEAYKQRREQEAAHLSWLRTISYREYLRTEHWQSIRKAALKRAKFRCKLCKASGQLHVHHNSYEHRGEEHFHMDDIITLCKACHQKHHNIEE